MTEISSIRSALDPEQTLPQVELVPDPERPLGQGSMLFHHMLVMSDGEQIGSATLVSSDGRMDREEHFNGVTIMPKLRGRGYGTATYLAAINHAFTNGREFRSHGWTQTEAATKVWGRLIDAGVVQVVQPITYSHTEKNGIKKYTSDLRIIPEKSSHA